MQSVQQSVNTKTWGQKCVQNFKFGLSRVSYWQNVFITKLCGGSIRLLGFIIQGLASMQQEQNSILWLVASSGENERINTSCIRVVFWELKLYKQSVKPYSHTNAIKMDWSQVICTDDRRPAQIQLNTTPNKSQVFIFLNLKVKGETKWTGDRNTCAGVTKLHPSPTH